MDGEINRTRRELHVLVSLDDKPNQDQYHSLPSCQVGGKSRIILLEKGESMRQKGIDHRRRERERTLKAASKESEKGEREWSRKELGRNIGVQRRKKREHPKLKPPNPVIIPSYLNSHKLSCTWSGFLSVVFH